MKTTIKQLKKTLRILMLCLCIGIGQSASAQYVTINDSSLINALRTTPLTSACVNGHQVDSACVRRNFSNSNLNISAMRDSVDLSELDLIPGVNNISVTMDTYTVITDFPKHRLDVAVLSSTQGLMLSHWPKDINWLEISGRFNINAVPRCDSCRLGTLQIQNFDTIGLVFTYFPQNTHKLLIGNTTDTCTTTIQSLPDSLSFLQLIGNVALALPNLPDPLLVLAISDDSLVHSLPALPLHLTNLDINNYYPSYFLNNIPFLPYSLLYLNLSGHKLCQLPVLPPNLSFLRINNYFDPRPDTILTLPNSLRGIDLINSSGGFINLPRLPDSIGSLRVIPIVGPLPNLFPSTLSYIALSGNFSSLPPIPHGLRSLELYSPNLLSLSSLPDTLENFSIAEDTIITSLPSLPRQLKTLFINGCSNLRCLPVLPSTLTQIELYHTPVSCIPNWPYQMMILQSDRSYYPICNHSGCPYGQIYGYAFDDTSNNCTKDPGERPFKYKTVSLNDGEQYAFTNDSGYYRFNVDTGVYKVQQFQRNAYFGFSCDSGVYTHLIVPNDSARVRQDFPNKVLVHCPLLNVDIATQGQRFCQPENNRYVVHYCNYGSATADSTYIEVTYDSIIVPLSSTLPWYRQQGQTYSFYLGTLPPDSCGSFTIYDSVSTNIIPAQTVTATAIIYPHQSCIIPSGWDSSELTVQRSFSPAHDSVIFTVRNTGRGMTGPAESRIYEDDVLIASSFNQLSAGQAITFEFLAHGTTYRIESDQRPAHPGVSRPRRFNELTGGPAYSLHHIVPIPQDDMDPWVSIDVHEARCSYDPNEKEVLPAGVGPNHYVTNQDELNYIIHFQNTGNDTAYKVVVVDTLDYQHLDVTTLYAGAASKPYTYDINGRGILTFTFNNILLPDSHTNMAGSEGFVKYTIRQKANLSPGTRINNYADIYFDNNAPVRTNTAFVTIQDKSRIFPLSIVEAGATNSRYRINAYPNPFEEQLHFDVSSAEHLESLRFELSDILGNKIIDKNVGVSFSISRNEMTAGIYIYSIYKDNTAIGSGKIVAR